MLFSEKIKQLRLSSGKLQKDLALILSNSNKNLDHYAILG